MADRLAEYASKSLTRFIETAVGVNDSYIITPDFDWDKRPDPQNPVNSQVTRSLPYAGVQVIVESDLPFTVSSNILYEKSLLHHVWLCGSTFTERGRLTSDLRQALRGAVSLTSGVGITLYNFASPSGNYYATGGTLQVELGDSQLFDADSQAEEGNRKFRSVTPVTLTAFKDITATLLENMGRVSLTDL